MPGNKSTIRNDEATSTDLLDRGQYADVFAQMAGECDTPLVIGLYGTWGVGKTSLMKMIAKGIAENNVQPVWFEAWQHQFDENPAVALMHKVVEEFNLGEEGRKLLAVIAGAFGSVLLKATTTLGIKDIDALGERYEKERFLTRDAQVKLKEHFEKLIKAARAKHGKRIAFFIDDLDRCMPETTLALLESLKLYLNLDGCVYFLGVDRHALETSIRHKYEKLDVGEADYLDKIIQLPFTIPPIDSAFMVKFITELLHDEELKGCSDILNHGMEGNPRHVVRFVNTLTLNHKLAKAKGIQGYSPEVLALLLLIQLRDQGLYRLVCRKPERLRLLKEDNEDEWKLLEKSPLDKERFKNVLGNVDVPDDETVNNHIHLTNILRVSEDACMDDIAQSSRQGAVKRKTAQQRVAPASKLTEAPTEADFSNEDLSGKDLRGANLAGKYFESYDLSKALMMEADLSNAYLTHASLIATDLTGADLTDANLEGADLTGANLTGANLKGADLTAANLIGANLIEADLSMADLTGADLTATDLGGANLKGADLTAADLSMADLSNARGLTKEQVDSAITNKNTRLPDYLK